MWSLNLPSVLGGKDNESGISMERALRQIKQLLENIEPESDAHQDKINASIDDVNMMLGRIQR